MRVIVWPPEMKLAAAIGLRAVAVFFPIGNSVDAVRIRLVRRPLQTAPDEMLDVIIERFDFPPVGILGLLRREIRRMTQPGVIAGDGVNAKAADAIVIVRAQQQLLVHRPLGDESVVPFGRVAMLAVRDERRAFLDQRLERFGGKEFQVNVLIVAVTNEQTIFAELRKLHFVQMRVAFRAQRFDLRLFGKLGVDRFDFLFRAQGELGGEIARQGHARHDLHVDLAFVDENLPDGIVIVGPQKLESISLAIAFLSVGRECQTRVGLAPVGPVRLCRRAGNGGMNEHAITAKARFPIFQRGVSRWHHREVRSHDRGPRFPHPEQKRSVAGNETMFEDDRAAGRTTLSSATLSSATATLSADDLIRPQRSGAADAGSDVVGAWRCARSRSAASA